MYLVKASRILKSLYPNRVWNKDPKAEKIIYLSFDDGPHKTATPFVLQTLAAYNAKATFFCIGKNIEAYSEIFNQIKEQGHSIGNHTYSHLNGWKTALKIYIDDIIKTNQLMQSKLFRPPYGRMKKKQERRLLQLCPDTEIVMWDVLSGDFDTKITPEKCWQSILKNTENGSIIVFHDSAKAFERMQYALPKTLAHFSKQGFKFMNLPMH